MSWILSLSRRLLSVELDEVTLKTNGSQVARCADALADGGRRGSYSGQDQGIAGAIV